MQTANASIRSQLAVQAHDAVQQGIIDHGNYRAAAGQLHGLNAHLNGSQGAPDASSLALLKPARRPTAFEGKKRNLQALK